MFYIIQEDTIMSNLNKQERELIRDEMQHRLQYYKNKINSLQGKESKFAKSELEYSKNLYQNIMLMFLKLGSNDPITLEDLHNANLG
jgi:ribonucleotide reductase beta subunit family protein with ferritin-like domain